MTTSLETATGVHEAALTADELYLTLLRKRDALDAKSLGIFPTEVQEMPERGPHRLLVLDESLQPGNNFKYNGAAAAVSHLSEGVTHVETGSAGSFGAALAIAGQARGLNVTVRAPHSLVPAKRQLMEEYGARVVADYKDVAEAIAAGQRKETGRPDTVFVHPFDNLDVMSGQALVGKRLVDGLAGLAVQGNFDLQTDPVRILVQTGGGSLLSGVACAVRELKDNGACGDNVQIVSVRPERQTDGTLNILYDGLAVEQAGPKARLLMEDGRFVQGKMEISEADTARAGLLLARHLHKRIEPSGLAGVAAFEQLRHGQAEPTVYVAVLSGANTSADTYRYLSTDVLAADQKARIARALAGPVLRVPVAPAGQTNRVWSGHNFPRAPRRPGPR